MITILFLGALAAFILGGAAVVIWLLNGAGRRPDPIAVDALADLDARRADDWSREEWWR